MVGPCSIGANGVGNSALPFTSRTNTHEHGVLSFMKANKRFPHVGPLAAGPHNAISDVTGVTAGHCSLDVTR